MSIKAENNKMHVIKVILKRISKIRAYGYRSSTMTVQLKSV